jgi:hypothetical protein
MYDQERQDQLRKLWKLCYTHCDRAIRRFCKRTGFDVEEVERAPWRYMMEEGLELPSFPDVLSELTCGAKTRKGTPCKRRDLYRSGRCKFHGGMSTGPTSEEGKRRSAMNGCRNPQ